MITKVNQIKQTIQTMNREALTERGGGGGAGGLSVCGGREYLFLCSPEINRFAPLFTKTKIWIFYVPCSPKMPFISQFPSFLDLCSLVPLK